jgi:hypothetical protein
MERETTRKAREQAKRIMTEALEGYKEYLPEQYRLDFAEGKRVFISRYVPSSDTPEGVCIGRELGKLDVHMRLMWAFSKMLILEADKSVENLSAGITPHNSRRFFCLLAFRSVAVILMQYFWRLVRLRFGGGPRPPSSYWLRGCSVYSVNNSEGLADLLKQEVEFAVDTICNQFAAIHIIGNWKEPVI